MSESRPRIPITPATKVADLLAAWPELEEVLIAQAPAFRRLKNPVLRRTVARVATLEQAAGVGGIPVRDLVERLRRAAGLPAEEGSPEAGTTAAAAPPPAWLEPSRVATVVDAEAILAAGEVPLGRVLAAARALCGQEILRIDSTFRPAPLLEALAKQGFRCHAREETPGRFATYVTRP